MKLLIPETDRKRLKTIYESLKQTKGELQDLGKIEKLAAEALVVAAIQGTHTALYQSLQQTVQEQLRKAIALPDRDKGKPAAIAEARLFLIGDLLGWF